MKLKSWQMALVVLSLLALVGIGCFQVGS